MTKAVGDFLGTNGIADEMIRFNGFPFLEKEDHAYNVTGQFPMVFAREMALNSSCSKSGFGDEEGIAYPNRDGYECEGYRFVPINVESAQVSYCNRTYFVQYRREGLPHCLC